MAGIAVINEPALYLPYFIKNAVEIHNETTANTWLAQTNQLHKMLKPSLLNIPKIDNPTTIANSGKVTKILFLIGF